MTNKKTFKINAAFGLPAPDSMVLEGYDQPGLFTPALKPGYQFRKEWFREFNAWYQAGDGEGLYMSGPTGCGKTSFIKQFHAVLNLPMQFLPGNKRTEPIHLIGSHQLIDGDTIFVDGPLTTAMRLGQTFLLNEGDLVTPASNSVLHAVAEGYPLVIAANGGEVVKPAKGFRLIIDGNSIGAGDPGGSYAAIQRQSLAFMDRFWVMNVDYPDKATEMAILANTAAALPEAIREKMIDVANDVRSLFMDVSDTADAIELTFSTRTLTRWAGIALLFKDAPHPVEYALTIALTNRANLTSKEAIESIMQRHFGDATGVV